MSRGDTNYEEKLNQVKKIEGTNGSSFLETVVMSCEDHASCFLDDHTITYLSSSLIFFFFF